MNTIASVIIGLLGAVDFVTLLIFFINRHDQKKGLEDKLKTLEKDGLRTQLLMLILLQPDAKQEILTVGQHYFRDLKGNWYMSDVFNRWCIKHGQEPDWFDKEG